jgi:hypothetical protein
MTVNTIKEESATASNPMTNPNAEQWWTLPEDPKVKLWRYMDLSKFVSLLQSRCIAFARADLLGDPFEGSVGRLNAGEAEAVMRLRDSMKQDDFWRTRTDEQIRAQFAGLTAMRKKMIKSMYVSCWHMNEHESAAMWKLYSQSSDAICVRTRFDLLREQIPSWIQATTVRYIDFENSYIPWHNSFTPFAHKRASFAHEQELRFLAWDWADPAKQKEDRTVDVDADSRNAPAIVSFRVDLSHVIEEVKVSPA